MKRRIMPTEAAQRAYNCASALLVNGIYPGPKIMHEILRGWSRNNLNGRESRSRAQALSDYGYRKDELTGRYHRPRG